MQNISWQGIRFTDKIPIQGHPPLFEPEAINTVCMNGGLNTLDIQTKMM